MKEEECSSRESRKAETGGKQLTLPNQNQIYYILKVNLFHFDLKQRATKITFSLFLRERIE